MLRLSLCLFFFFFNDTATTEIYTLSLHDALPISDQPVWALGHQFGLGERLQRDRGREHCARRAGGPNRQDRKSTRLNSSHLVISYAVFCLKKKKKKRPIVKTVYNTVIHRHNVRYI